MSRSISRACAGWRSEELGGMQVLPRVRGFVFDVPKPRALNQIISLPSHSVYSSSIFFQNPILTF